MGQLPCSAARALGAGARSSAMSSDRLMRLRDQSSAIEVRTSGSASAEHRGTSSRDRGAAAIFAAISMTGLEWSAGTS